MLTKLFPAFLETRFLNWKQMMTLLIGFMLSLSAYSESPIHLLVPPNEVEKCCQRSNSFGDECPIFIEYTVFIVRRD